MNKYNSTAFLLFISSVAALGGFLLGYDTGVINGTQFYFSKYFDLSAATKGWVVGSALVGCFIGALIAGPLSTRFGRKWSLIAAALLFTVSAWGSGLPSILPESVSLLVFFRIVGGVGIGMAAMSAPMYIAELSPAKKRGQMVTFYQMAIVLGFFLVFVTTYLIGSSDDQSYNENYGWRVMFWSELVPCLLFLSLLFFVPKSPRWLYLKGKEAEANRVLVRVHGAALAEMEMQGIRASVTKKGGLTFSEVLKGSLFPIVLIGAAFAILQQFTGINAVLYYGADIFEKALGFGQEDVLAQQILLAGVNVIFTVIAMSTVDLWGRRPLIVLGSLGMLAGFACLGVSIQTGQVGLFSLIGILLFIGSFAMSVGPVFWVVLSEMYPNNMRSVGMSLAIAAQWAANYAVSQTFPMVMESKINLEGFWNGALPYYLFMGFISIIIFFTLKFIPETKGRSLEDIEKIWESKFGNPKKS